MADPFALVIGGSGGIGAEISLELARRGQRIVLTYGRGKARADEVLARIHDLGGNGTARQLTLPDGDLGDLTGLHTLVFAAGAPIEQPYVSQMGSAALEEAVQIELLGFANAVRQALPALRASQGSIVAVSSAGISRHPPGDALSTVPKAGAFALIRAIAREEGRHGIRANAVAVGVVDAGMFQSIGFDDTWRDAALRNIPLRRFGSATDVARAAAFLASDDAGYITGEMLHVDGGYHV